MSAYSWTCNSNIGSATAFNAMFAGVQAVLTGAGWIQTNDTGQINLTTNTGYPTAANQSMGYQVWRMDDALQSTAPVIMKIEFGSAGSTNIPGVWITIGNGSDGAGSITGIVLTRTQLGFGSGNLVYTHQGAGGKNWLFLSFCPTYGANMAFCLERTHDTQGNDTGDGILFVGFSGSPNTLYSKLCPFSGLAPAMYNKWNTVVPPTGSGALSPNINAYAVRCWAPGETLPLHGVMAFVSGDFGMNATFAITGWDGRVRTYLSVGSTAVGYGGTAYSLWRYE